ncbi:MAG: hypothetical protein WC121_12790 [Candidatus Kapaibacterium sp.]
MKYLFSILIFLTLFNYSEAEQSDIGLSFKINKSAVVLPFEKIKQDQYNSKKKIFIVNGTFGLAVDLFYKVKRRTYYNLSLEYDFLSINDDLVTLTPMKLTGSMFKVLFGGVRYLNPPDEFTPYFGYGVGLYLINSNQEDVYTYKDFDGGAKSGNLFPSVAVSLELRGGLLFPINENLSITAGVDVGIISAEFLGLIPKLQVGGVYWLD